MGQPAAAISEVSDESDDACHSRTGAESAAAVSVVGRQGTWHELRRMKGEEHPCSSQLLLQPAWLSEAFPMGAAAILLLCARRGLANGNMKVMRAVAAKSLMLDTAQPDGPTDDNMWVAHCGHGPVCPPRPCACLVLALTA